MKSMRCWIFVIATIGIAFAREGYAAPTRQADELRFKKLDANRDKLLSEVEFLADKAGNARAKARKEFKTLDSDRNELLSFKEFRGVY